MKSSTATVWVVLILAVAAVIGVHLWTTGMRYEISGDGKSAHVLDRKTGEVTWIAGGHVRKRVK